VERVRCSLETAAASASQRQGIQSLTFFLVRVVKGQVAMRLEVWRTAVMVAAHARHVEIQTALGAQIRQQGQAAGMGLLQQFVVRLVKGHTAMRLGIWRTGGQVAAQTQAAETQARLQTALEARVVAQGGAAGGVILKLVVVRLVKGETALRLAAWRTGLQVTRD
jgi:hypothetical protein